MLKQRILATLKFFDLQDTPLTLLELHKFLLADIAEIKKHLDGNWELAAIEGFARSQAAAAGEILSVLENECRWEVESQYGFYALAGRRHLIQTRLDNYSFGIRREQLIKKFVGGTRHLPFLRGMALVGSQALGQQKEGSDIDLLILVAPKFMWLARFFITAYFQILGRRRHGKKIADRFCLNHYLIEGKSLSFDRNLYTAAEYLKLRPLVYGGNLAEFQKQNKPWITLLYPNAAFADPAQDRQSAVQIFLERLFGGKFGKSLQDGIKKIQYSRLDIGEFIVASDEELSFHPDNRKKDLFRRFFEFQK